MPVPEDVVASNLTLQSYHGKPVLGWWQGRVTKNGPTETGEDVVVDEHYHVVARLHASGGWVLTLHEFLIDSEGHAWVTANKNIAKDLSAYGGAYNGALVDSAVQEYDLATGKLMRSWDALKHISLHESVATVPTNGFPWDAYHVNSIQLVAPGKFLVSMRNTWAAYLVDAASGRIEWTLGGRKSSFKFAPGAGFEWQHDVRIQPRTSTVSLFDDHCCQLTGGGTSVKATGPSRGLVIRLTRRNRTASLVSQYGEREGFETEYMGDTQPLSGGGAFVGWGSEPYFSEYDSSGKLRFEGTLPEPDRSYRAQLEPWEGMPETKPAARGADAKDRRRRSSRAGTERPSSPPGACSARAPPAGRCAVLATAPRSGFETSISVPSGVRELRGAGARLGRAHARYVELLRTLLVAAGRGRGERPHPPAGVLAELELAVAVDHVLAAAAQLRGHHAVGGRDDVRVDARVVEAEPLPLLGRDAPRGRPRRRPGRSARARCGCCRTGRRRSRRRACAP